MSFSRPSSSTVSQATSAPWLHAQSHPLFSSIWSSGQMETYRLAGDILIPAHSAHLSDHAYHADADGRVAVSSRPLGAAETVKKLVHDLEAILNFIGLSDHHLNSDPSLPKRLINNLPINPMYSQSLAVPYLCNETKKGKPIASFRMRIPAEDRKYLGNRSEAKLRLPDYLTTYDKRLVIEAMVMELRETVKANRLAGVSAPFVSKVLKRIKTDHQATMRVLRSAKSVKKLVTQSLSTHDLPRPILPTDVERLSQFFAEKNLSELQDRLFDAALSDDELDTMLQTAQNNRIRLQRALVKGNIDVVKPVIPELEKAAGVSVSVSEEETVKKLLQQLLLSLRDAAEKEVAILQGNETKKHEQPVNPIDEGPFVSELVTAWAEAPASDKSPKSLAEGRRAAELWDEYCIDKYGRPLALHDTTREEVAHFVGHLKSKIARNRTTPYSNGSIKKYVGLISAAINYSILDLGKQYVNPFTHQTRKLKCKKNRVNFGTDQLQSIFANAEFQSMLQDTKGAGQGTAMASLIALGTGARLGEIIQLQAQDIEFDGDYTYIKIRSAEFEDEGVEQDTKTDESREALILPMVMETAAGDFLRKAKRSGGAVFKCLDKYSNPTDRVSKKFAGFLNRVGVKEKKFVFHSFRHTFYEAARCVTSPGPIPKQVLSAQIGHEGNGAAKYGYGSGLFPRAVLTDQIRHIGFNDFDLIAALNEGVAAYNAEPSK